jgi:hypothetical protein
MSKFMDELRSKRRDALSIHYLDSNIFMSPLYGDEYREICDKYLARANKKFRAVTGQSVIGEIMATIYNDRLKNKSSSGDEFQNTITLLRDLAMLMQTSALEVCGFPKGLPAMSEKIRQLDNRIELGDSMHLAGAFCYEGCKFFVTTEKNMLGNRRELSIGGKRIQIMSPDEFTFV